jgi:hypothetical protein
VKRYKRLPNTPTKEDLEAVAAKLLALQWNSHQQQWNVTGPVPNRDFIKMIVGYALTCKMRLPAIAATVDEVRYQARKHGRPFILAADLRSALLDYQIPSDKALQQAFEPEVKRNEGWAIPTTIPNFTRNPFCNAAAHPLHSHCIWSFPPREVGRWRPAHNVFHLFCLDRPEAVPSLARSRSFSQGDS